MQRQRRVVVRTSGAAQGSRAYRRIGGTAADSAGCHLTLKHGFRDAGGAVSAASSRFRTSSRSPSGARCAVPIWRAVRW